jgi:DNA-binding transcriptional LysR family regulator
LSFHEEPGPRSWQLSGPHGAKKQVTLNPVLTSSEFNIVIEAASAGMGVAFLPVEFVSRSIAQARLVRLLPSWHSTEVTLHIVFRSRRGLAAAVRAFIDYVVEHYEAAHRAYMV